MKGISTVLAAILLVIIVVGLITLTWSFATNMFGSSTQPAEVQVSALNQRIDKIISFAADPECKKLDSGWEISFLIKHEGATYNITYSDITVLFGSELLEVSATEWNSPLAPKGIRRLSFKSSEGAVWRTDILKVISPANDISRTVECP
jgi:hypothetical protein